MLAHRGVVNLGLAERTLFDVQPGSRVLQLASFSFDASIWEILMALVTGATLIMVPRAAAVPGPDLIDLLRAEEVSVATIMASVLAALPEGVERSLPALRTVIVSGEACPGALASRWARDRRFFNVYGPTEASCVTTVAECNGDGTDPPIGKPIQGTTCHVLDPALRPISNSEPGELYIGGVGVGRAYLGQPGLTAARFVPDPFSATPGARLYRTGDLVQQIPGGDLHFVGRVDHQVKIRGHRIELGEIESTLGLHAEVRSALVVAREGRLIAYVVPRSDDGPQRGELAAALRRHLRDRLPEPMIPSVFVILDALPLTPNGKVDRAKLPVPDPAAQARDEEATAPRSELEATIAAVWAEALGLERIGVEDDVFDLGGHSLLIARVLSRLRGALGVEIPLRHLFEARTASALARAVEGLKPAARGAVASPIPRVPHDRPLPLSYGQRQIWLHAKLRPGALFYNEPATIRIPGRLDVPALSGALDELVRRHEALRTTFTSLAGEPAQRTHPPGPFELPIVDLLHLPEEARWESAVALATAQARRPFDLEQGPLFRATLVRVGAADHALFVTAHHIVI
ncbi:MAG TPA: AMP-binding protein, partial [Candidatus Nanopelagicales bacterium]|nr:AMP-binding protein [Candidatus Nanopelagicales bacterium]